ncbi:MAG: hypothetical protein KF735_25450, partial [Chelatococcus sp.]|uniref:hypothetical protein n=1 Tax=Chelatococcus sp. TaxID=1953771 RepID=UPI0025C0F194
YHGMLIHEVIPFEEQCCACVIDPHIVLTEEVVVAGNLLSPLSVSATAHHLGVQSVPPQER